MKINFDENEKKILEKLDVVLKEDYSDEDILKMDELVMEYFQLHGIRDGDEINEIGLTCESIIDKLS